MSKNALAPYELTDLDTPVLAMFVIFTIIAAIALAIGSIFVLAEGGSWILLGLLFLAVAGFIVKYIRTYAKELGRRFE